MKNVCFFYFLLVINDVSVSSKKKKKSMMFLFMYYKCSCDVCLKTSLLIQLPYPTFSYAVYASFVFFVRLFCFN